MMITEHEAILAGGNVNTAVVRVGKTVRRAMSASSPTIHQLLDHLAAKGFAGSPRFLGVDEQGREILTFIQGATGIPTSIWQRDEPLIAAAKLLREFHDATVDFIPQLTADEPAPPWANPYPDAARHEVICHNDFAPYNFVYADGPPSGIPIAIIDFDLAGPGPRLRDIAYAAYWMVPLSFNSADQTAFTEADLTSGGRRLRLFCESYGVDIEPALFEMIEEVLTFMGSEAEMARLLGKEAAQKLIREGHLIHWKREAAAFRTNRWRIEANLFAD